MGSRTPGPICSSRLGPDWIDSGTLCRSRSDLPVPLGSQPDRDRGNDRGAAVHVSTAIRLAISLIMAAAPEESLASDEPEAPRAAKSEPESYEERFPAAKAMIDDDIDKIARSPWGGTTEGKEIVRRLRRLSAEGNIKYGDTPEARGSFGGKDILVSEDYYGKMCQTILELVHEGSHANWRDWHKRHGPRTGKKSTDRIEEYKEEELHAVKNQLVIYRWLKTKFRSFTDSQLETRLKQEAANTLRDAIEQGIQSGKSKH